MKNLLVAFLLISSCSYAFEPVKNASASYCSSVLSDVFASGEEKKMQTAQSAIATSGTYLVQIHAMNPQLGVPDLAVKIIAKVNGEIAFEFPTRITVNESAVVPLEFAKTYMAGDKIEIFVSQNLGHPVTVALWFQLIPVPPGEQ